MAAKHMRTERDRRDKKDREAEKGVLLARGNVFTRFTVRSLRANRVRTTVTIVGIMLAAGLLMAVLSSVTSLRAALLDKERSLYGAWQVGFTYADAEKLDDLRAAAGDHLDRLALQRDLGAAALDTQTAAEGDPVLGVLSLPEEQDGCPHAAGDDAFEVLPTPAVEEGRLPEKPGEIALPSYLQGRALSDEGASVYGEGTDVGAASEGELELGSKVTLALGRRTDAIDPSTTIPSDAMFRGDYYYDRTDDGTLTLTMEHISEQLGDVGAPRTYAVVGFVSSGAAYVSADEPAATASGADVTTAYFSTTGYASERDLRELMTRALGDAGYMTNDTLLTYQGMSDRAIFDSLAVFAAVLAAVIMVAAVSLVAGAFTISISERTRQFGLLSSLGASRRQLRRTVFTEAAILGAIGIPAGLLVGMAATAAVFALTADGWAFMVGDDVTVGLVIAPADVAVAAGLAAVTLVVSALVPAVRASRVSAVDAIRASRDVRPSRRLACVFRRRHDAMDGFSADRRRPRGLAARLGGMPAFLARRQLKVSGGKSRTAAVALAVSVALLVSAGLVGDYLTGSLSYQDMGDGDLEVYLSSGSTAEDVGSDAAVTDAEGIMASVAGVEGVGRVWPQICGMGSVRVAPEDVDWDAVARYDELMDGMRTFRLDREGYGDVLVYLLDDATWRTLAGNVGLTGTAADPASLSCVALNATDATTTGSYGTISPLTGTGGEMSLLVEGDLEDGQWLGIGDDGRFGLITVDMATGEQTSFSPASELDLEEVRVPVAATVSELGDDFPMSVRQLAQSNGLTYLMPLSAALGSDAARALRTSNVIYWATFAEGADEEATVDGIEEALAALDDLEYVGVYNVAESMREARAMSFTVNVFLYSFTAVTLAIAVANVFNTIASGLMLRTREFAALQSAGMGRRAFRRMIALECADFACKGLVGGIALAALVDVGFYLALRSSIVTLELALPWVHVALACAVVVGTLALAAAYALRKTHAMNLVEALRADAV